MTDDQPKQKPERTPENKALSGYENKAAATKRKPAKKAAKHETARD
jgi:hypothetical protein